MELTPLGDAAVLIRFGSSIDDCNPRVHAAAALLEAARPPGFLEVVPAYTTLAVHYDPPAVARIAPHRLPYDTVCDALRARLADSAAAAPLEARTVEIPVCYGDAFGPDLAAVAEHAGMTVQQAARAHAAGEYRVAMLGFLPGFPYLLGLPQLLATPRRARPRLVVPAGSVGIAGGQTGIYPFDSPGGWQLIGRTPLRLFDPTAEAPARLRPGDRVRFHAIDHDEYRRIQAELA